MRRGEVWWHEPPDSKRRPVLILTRDEAVDRVFNVIDRSRLQRDRGPGDGHCPRSCNGGRDRTRRWDADRVRACARQHPLRRKGVPDRAHHDAWPGEDGRGLLGARHGDELPLTDAHSVPCSRSIAAIVSWFKYRPVRAMKVAGSESCTSPRTLAKAANILGFWFSRSRLFPAVLGTRTANGPQRRAKGTASDTVRCLTPRCSSVGGLRVGPRACSVPSVLTLVKIAATTGIEFAFDVVPAGREPTPQCLQGHAGSFVRRRLDPCCISLIRSRVSSRLCPRDQRSGGRPSGSRLGRCGRSACRRRARGSAR